jgi:transcriptional/translational regulatory protein YebC/TACO1
VAYEEIVYEGYGPGGVAILVETATDNKNRTAADVRSIFAKSGGQLAGSGSVAWQFEPRGVVSVELGGSPSDDIALLAIDAAVDVDTSPTPWRSRQPDLRPCDGARGGRSASIGRDDDAGQGPHRDDSSARQNLRLIEALEDDDDVQRVTANFELPDEILAEAAAS